VTLITALIAALLHGLFGLLMAWILVRYEFPGRRLLDAMMDLLFALPTAVAGLTLSKPDGATIARRGRFQWTLAS